jgi:hypothetical protein
MRILVCHPGATMSTHDVWRGLTDGLRARGHELFDYALDGRIERSGQYLTWCWKKGGKSVDRPNQADILYHAGEELVARALRVQPDVVLIVSAMFLHPDIVVLLKRAGLNVAILFTESPYDDERQIRLMPFCDVAWTNERTSAQAMRCHYLPHAWHSDIHVATSLTSDDIKQHDVVFVGTAFQERCDFLSAVDWTGIDLGLYGGWQLLGSRNPLRKYVQGGYIENAAASRLYQRAKIGLNLYRQSKGFGRNVPRVSVAESLSPRAYELAALGCFTLSEPRAEVGEKFGELVPTFATPQELGDLIRRWLADDIGRARIQSQLPVVVAQDTWHTRAGQVETDLLDAGIGAREGSSSDAREARAAGG